MRNGGDDEYWASYTPIQQTKHALLEAYLGGWFPILASFSGRVVYVDSHAGRGRHAGGELGSPLVALETLLNHSFRDRILAKCTVEFMFLERNPAHVDQLKTELASLGTLPAGTFTDIVCGDYADAIAARLDHLEEQSKDMPPSFFFIDPYGFKLPMVLMKRILAEPRSELLLTFMFRYIDMAFKQDSCSEVLDALFGTDAWRRIRDVEDVAQRHADTIRTFTAALGAEHWSVTEMRGTNRAIKYSLIHATNHRKGRELMKDVMWKVTDGSYKVYQSSDPNQMTLLELEPDLSGLREVLLSEFRGKSVRYAQLRDWALGTNWRYTHLHETLRALRAEGKLEATCYQGKLAYNLDKNPRITFS